MKRKVSLEEISDGKLYGSNDMVKADCNGCSGCSACCQGMGNSIILDPLDLYRIEEHLGKSFKELLQSEIELNVVDGIILPNLKMSDNSEQCVFLSAEGRCMIHSFRPGVCRLFPLGRYYENGSFQYFLQVHECPRENKTKVKVRKWIDTPDLKTYEKFVTDWHYFLDDVETLLEQTQKDGDRKQINLYLLNSLYLRPYPSDKSFYESFYERLKEAGRILLK